MINLLNILMCFGGAPVPPLPPRVPDPPSATAKTVQIASSDEGGRKSSATKRRRGKGGLRLGLNSGLNV